MSGLLGMAPRVVRDTDDELVVEESHIGRVPLALVFLFFAGAFLVPAVQSGEIVMVVIGLVMGTFIVGVPFLLVFAGSSYRRLEIRPGREVVVVRVYRLWPARPTRTGWDEFARVSCRRVYAGDNPDGLVLTAHLPDGAERVFLRGWWSEALAEKLAARFGERFEVDD